MAKKNKDIKKVVAETIAGSLIVIGEKRGGKRQGKENRKGIIKFIL
jgi:hypothetical protein